MTTLIPKQTLGDRILGWFGKHRAYRFPRGMYAKHGPHAIGMAGKEPFLRALLRPKGTPPPAGWFTLEDPGDADDGAESQREDFMLELDEAERERLLNLPLDMKSGGGDRRKPPPQN